jgi:hypothetical protein
MIFYEAFFVTNFLCLGMHMLFSPSLGFAFTEDFAQKMMFITCALCEKKWLK